MARITFKARFIEPILSGSKTATLRKSSFLQEGQVVDAYCRRDRPPFARLQIVSRREIGLSDIDDIMASREGFETAAELRAALTELYPGEETFIGLVFERVPDGAL